MCREYTFPQILSIKKKRLIIGFFYHVGIVSMSLAGSKVSTITNSPALLHISSLLLLFHIVTFRIIPISRWIQEKLIQEATCFTCGTVIDLVSLHRCGCSFIGYKERHAFSPCPMCKKQFLWVVCPVCEISIPI